MPDQNTSPETRIFVSEVELDPALRADVLDLRVGQYSEGGDLFEIVINTLSAEDQQLRWIDDDRLTPGNAVRIEAGYRGETAPLIEGEITALHAQFPNALPSRIAVQGFDALHRLRRGRVTRAYYETKDSQIAETVARTLNLTPDVQDTEIVYPYLLQNNQSDIDYLLMRARRIRYELRVTEGRLIFRETSNDLGETLTLEFPTVLKSFHPRLTTAEQSGELTVRGWNPATKEPILGRGQPADQTTLMEGTTGGPAATDAAFGETVAQVVRLPVGSQAEADQIAKGRFNEMALGYITGDAEAVGNPAIRAGVTVRITGVGDRFSGLYYIRSAEHRIDPRVGYVTKFTVARNSA